MYFLPAIKKIIFFTFKKKKPWMAREFKKSRSEMQVRINVLEFRIMKVDTTSARLQFFFFFLWSARLQIDLVVSGVKQIASGPTTCTVHIGQLG
jgi:hypothetical protein